MCERLGQRIFPNPIPRRGVLEPASTMACDVIRVPFKEGESPFGCSMYEGSDLILM